MDLDFIETTSDSRLREIEADVRAHAVKDPGFTELMRDPEFLEQYKAWRKTKDSGQPVIGPKVKDFVEYKLRREELRRCVDLWKGILDDQAADLKFFR